jgi:hypothetical protein
MIGGTQRLLLAALLALAARAHADEDSAARAEDLFRKGYERYHAADYSGAIKQFEAAAQIHPSPVLDYNMAKSYEQLGNKPLAIKLYKKYLESNPPEAKQAEAEERIAKLSFVAPPPPPPPPPKPPEVVCPSGKTVSGGHCCWPAQTWSVERDVCTGTPHCPEGMEARDENCFRVALPPPPPPPPPAPLPPWPETRVPKPRKVQVDFASRDPDRHYTIAISDAERWCKTPCGLQLTPGLHHVEVSGPSTFRDDLVVPHTATEVTIEQRSSRAIVAGALLLASGLLTTVISLSLIIAASSSVSATGSEVAGVALLPFAAGMITTGGIFLGKAGEDRLHIAGN